ncbi:hypothetical protein [Brevibacillus massiliensis]|jgi:hypothetical protein|uniref:hypothetical protein n=1 Tax=Brevibacillus massiliensis TaxID=1118054 RepID=UPI0002F43850|nr:hypothetical protein [Brevibacillus massiliensis]
MNGILFYRWEQDGDARLEYDFYENQFAPTNLVVHKVFRAMLDSVRRRLDRLEVEYNDSLLAEKLGRRAGEVLRFLGASRDNLVDHRSGDVVVSRSFHAELTEERFQYFYKLLDVAQFPRFRLSEGERERILFHFGQYLLLRIPLAEERQFYDQLESWQVPYKIRNIQK